MFCNPKAGGEYREESFAEALRAALKAAGVRATSTPSMTCATPQTRRRRLRLVTDRRIVFRDEADALERRLLGDRVPD